MKKMRVLYALSICIITSGIEVSHLQAKEVNSISFTCQPLATMQEDAFGIWKSDEIASALNGTPNGAKICVGKREINTETYIVSMLIGSDCSSSLCPVRVTKSGAEKRKQVLTTDMMCASLDFYSLSAGGKSLRACGIDYNLRNKQ